MSEGSVFKTNSGQNVQSWLTRYVWFWRENVWYRFLSFPIRVSVTFSLWHKPLFVSWSSSKCATETKNLHYPNTQVELKGRRKWTESNDTTVFTRSFKPYSPDGSLSKSRELSFCAAIHHSEHTLAGKSSLYRSTSDALSLHQKDVERELRDTVVSAGLFSRSTHSMNAARTPFSFCPEPEARRKTHKRANVFLLVLRKFVFESEQQQIEQNEVWKSLETRTKNSDSDESATCRYVRNQTHGKSARRCKHTKFCRQNVLVVFVGKQKKLRNQDRMSSYIHSSIYE